MRDETEKIRTCLDEALKREKVTTEDIARAMRSFVINCYMPVNEWIHEKMESERNRRAAFRQVAIHVVCWSIPVLLLFMASIFGDGLKRMFKAWLAG